MTKVTSISLEKRLNTFLSMFVERWQFKDLDSASPSNDIQLEYSVLDFLSEWFVWTPERDTN